MAGDRKIDKNNKNQFFDYKSIPKKKIILIFSIIGILIIASVSSVVFFAFQEEDGDKTKKVEEPDNILDSDNDGYSDVQDAFPDNPNEWLDTDKDGLGDNADPDDDNDGVPDVIEEAIGTDSKNHKDIPSDDELENFKDLPSNLTDYKSREIEGIIIYDKTSNNYKTQEAENTGYLVSLEKNTRNSEVNYTTTKIVVPENFSNIVSGNFKVISDMNATYLIKSIPTNTTDATNKILEDISQFDFQNVETDFISVGISYNHYTYGIGINENSEFIYVTFDDNPTMFTNVHVTGTVVPIEFFMKIGIINIDIMTKLNDSKNIFNMNIDDELPSFLIVNNMSYKPDIIKGDSYTVIRPNEVADLADNLSSGGILKLTNIARNITEQIIILGDYNNRIDNSTLWLIFSPIDLEPSLLTGIVEINVVESDFELLKKRLNVDFSYNIDLSFKIKVAVTHDKAPNKASDYRTREVHETWNDVKGSNEVMVESVQLNNFALVVDVENLIDGLAESLEISEDQIKHIKSLTSFRNPAIALLVDQNFTKAFEGDFDLLWNFSGLAILPEFNDYETRAIKSDSLLYHLRLEGVLYNLWNYLNLEHGILRDMPLIIADSYSILKETEITTLSELHNQKDQIIGDKTVSFLKVNGFLFGTSLKKIGIEVSEKIYPQISYLLKAIPIDIGFYDFMDFNLENDQIKTYHVPVLTLEWGFCDTILGNRVELEGFYVSIENAIQKGIEFSRELLNNTELGEEFNKYSKSIFNSPVLLDILEKASNSPAQLLKGFFLAFNYKELEPELETTLPSFYPAEALSNNEVKIHLEVEGIGIGTSLKTIAQGNLDDLPIDVGVYILFDRTKNNFPTYTPYYEVPLIFLTPEKAPTYLGKPIKVNGLYINTKVVRDSFIDSVSNFIGVDNTHPFDKLDQISTITRFTDNIIKVFDGFIYVYEISEVPEDLRPADLKITGLIAEDSIWVTSDPYDDYKVIIPENSAIKNGEWNFCYPKIKATIFNEGGQRDMANIQFLLTDPSNKQENINATSFNVPGGDSRPGYALKLIDEPEIGNYDVKAYLFKNGTFKEYIENKATTFSVKKLAGNISVKNMQMRSWETKDLEVNITNTGSFDTAYTVVAILIPDRFFGIYINDGNILSLNLIKFKTTSIISPGNTESIDFEISTRWSGGKIHLFLFNGTKTSMIDVIRDGLTNVISILQNSIQPGNNVIFEGIDSIIDYFMLSHGVSNIDFEYVEEIIGGNVEKSNDYYYGDGSDYVVVTLNMTIEKIAELPDYLKDWLWENRMMNVTIYKNNIFIKEQSRKLTLLDNFQLDPSKKNYEFSINIGENYGYGNFRFNVSLVAKDNQGIFRVIDVYQIQKEIRINISDAEIIDISPNVMPINTNNNQLKITVQNTGNVTQKFHVKLYDLKTGLDKWFIIRKVKETSISYESNEITIIIFVINSKSDSINGSFKISLEPYSSITDISDLDTKYHHINVGPKIKFIEISNSSSSGNDDTRYLDNRGYYIYCDLIDVNQINLVNLIYDYDGELINDIEGTISLTLFSGNQYRTISPIPENTSATKVTFQINASDNNIDPMYSLYKSSYSLWIDTPDYFIGAKTLTLGSSWNESIGYSNDIWDVFKITISSSQGVLFNLTHSVFSNFDLYFYNETYQRLSYSNSNFKIPFFPDEQIEWYFYPGATGTYYICVYYYDGIIKGPGNYTLSIKTGSVDAPKDYLKGFLVFDGTTVNGKLTPVTDIKDCYKIYLNVGQTLYVNMTSISTGSDFDLYLYNMTHNEKDSQSHHIPLNIDERASYTANIAGYYYIEVIYFIGLWGTYTLTFDVDG